MGQEIAHSHFTDADFSRFNERLRAETALLHCWFRDATFTTRDRVAGLELEAWLIDTAGRPAPVNAPLLEQLNDPLVVPELARFNIEINTQPVPLQSNALSRMLSGLEGTYVRCQHAAAQLDTGLLTIGILPTLHEQDLTSGNMSDVKRYRALNEQVLRQREGRPLKLDIQGREHLKTEHHTVMLEAATTSLQIHLKVAPAQAAHYYNLAQMLSAPMVAVSANSPYLFGCDLWSETRIPLFEQSVAVGGFGAVTQGPIRRVSFGSGYVHDSLFECFQENLEHFPVLLPMCSDAAPECMEHLRLHNGTIWRWNRPLIGFDAQGQAHLRIEHRVIPSGPSTLDAIANAAFYYGVVTALSAQPLAAESALAFDRARDNFYRAARLGLRAQLHWLDGKAHNARELLQGVLLPMAYQGLQTLGIADSDAREYLDIIAGRLHTSTNGAAWQRAFVQKNGADMRALTQAYQEQQNSGQPVHEWKI